MICLYPEGRAHCAEEGHHPWPRTTGCDWWFSRGFPVLSSGWSVPRVLQGVCGQEPRHQCCYSSGHQWHSRLVRQQRVHTRALAPLQHIQKFESSHPLICVFRRYTSMGFQYSYDQIPTAEALAAMLEKSPITHAAQVRNTHFEYRILIITYK